MGSSLRIDAWKVREDQAMAVVISFEQNYSMQSLKSRNKSIRAIALLELHQDSTILAHALIESDLGYSMMSGNIYDR